MSTTTKAHADAAEASLQGARLARQSGDHLAAHQLATAARTNAKACRDNATLMSSSDANDTARAETAADLAESYLSSGGRMGETPWRRPGSGSTSVAMARGRLEQIHAAASRRGASSATAGRRHAAVPVAGTRTPVGGRHAAPATSGTRSRLFESRWS